MSHVSPNVVIVLNMAGALLLGLLVGYERTYQGRAVGMRTYGLVCMASAALTALAGYPSLWYGGQPAAPGYADPTRVIQGIVTGIGFLGAGVIMKDGLSIRGLTTAASVWCACVIGMLVGMGFYPAAVLLAALALFCMLGVHRLEDWLPSRSEVAVMVQFKKGAAPRDDGALQQFVAQHGYELVDESLSITLHDGALEWHFIAAALDKQRTTSMPELAHLLNAYEGVESFRLAHVRN